MKKFLSLLLICSIFFVGNMTANAAERDLYEEIVNEYNEMYDISLEYVEVAPNTNIDEYRDFIARIASEERATLDYIASVEARNIMNSTITPHNIITERSTVTVTETKTASSASYVDASAYSVTCTFERYTNTIGNPTSVSVTVDSSIIIMRGYSQSSWSYNRYDSLRTLGITSKGSVTEHFTISGTSNTVANVTVYAEFYK